MTGIVMLTIAVVAAVVFGIYRARVDGRFARPTVEDTGERPAREHGAVWASVATALPHAELGERATLVQFSSAFCAPCRTTRVVLGEVASREDGVAHLEVDAEQHLQLVRELDVRRTPTTLVLDRDGHEITRAAGAPRREQVLAALPVLEEPR